MSRPIDADALKEEIEYYIREAGWGEVHNEALKWCLEFIDSQPTIEPKTPWIPFDEQQPEYRQEILVTIHWHESGEEEYFVQFDTYVNDATLDSNFNIGRDAFAWMPIPEPYREEGGQDG